MLLLLFIVASSSACSFNNSCESGQTRLQEVFSHCDDDILDIPCNVSDIPPFFLYGRRHVQLIFRQCGITDLRWQSIFSSSESIIDLSRCPLTCNCNNQWIWQQSRGFHLVLPSDYLCAVPHCKIGKISPAYEVIDAVIGDKIELDVRIEGDIYKEYVTSERSYFKWVFRANEHRFKEDVSENRLRLIISNATEADLGVVRVICWHCRQPLIATFELRIASPLRLSMESTGGSGSHLVVGGHPLGRMTLTVAQAGNRTAHETQLLPALNDQSTIKYWGSLVVRQDTAHSLFHHRVFGLFAASCSNCSEDLVSGNYSFTVCNTRPTASVDRSLQLLSNSSDHNETQLTDGLVECQTIYHVVNYNNETSIPHPPRRSSSLPVRTIVALILVALLLLVLGCYLAVRLSLFHWVRDKVLVWQKRRWSAAPGGIGSRRASRATEETMLRLEERGSLSSSDYSGQLIPCIKGGTVQIHESIGKGAFGEVYCGSWEKTGPRSVAVKAILQADEEIEKEANVLSRLDHPNIVRLHGMTRDGPRLLLVFEMMNLGDLRSYLKARAPQASNYSQFPPALIISELKFIIREIVKGVHYLGAQQIVHRDLAARNCLVHGQPDLRCSAASQRPPINVKISDFGMSRRLTYQSDYYRMQNQSLLPVRWLPPEAISEHRFSHGSDIWALGVTMWEVFSYGNVPFDTLSNHEVVSYAIAGMRPPRPRSCPLEMYNLMEKCWEIDPDERISSEELLLHPELDEAAREQKTVVVEDGTETTPLAV